MKMTQWNPQKTSGLPTALLPLTYVIFFKKINLLKTVNTVYLCISYHWIPINVNKDKDVFKTCTIWEGKMHGVTKIGIFRPLFCVNMLGKSTNYSTGTRPLCSTF